MHSTKHAPGAPGMAWEILVQKSLKNCSIFPVAATSFKNLLYITKKSETKVLYHQISRDPPPREGDWLSKVGDLEMSLTQLNFGSKSEMVKKYLYECHRAL